MITLALLLPLATALVIAMLPRSEPGLIRSLGLIGALLELGVIVSLIWSFDASGPAVQRAVAVPWVPAYGIAWSLGLDGRSLAPLLTLGLVFPLALLLGEREHPRASSIGLLGLQAAWIAVVLARDVITLGAAWELAAVLSVILLGERKLASVVSRRHAAHVLLGAAALIGAAVLLGVSHAHATGGAWSWDLDTLAQVTIPPAMQYLGFALVMLAVATALPLVPLHGALVRACVFGSTPVVAVLLGAGMPMAVFVLARVGMPMFPLAAGEWANPIAALAVVGAIYAGLVCWAEREPGRVLAHVAVLHVSLAVVGVLSGSVTARVGIGPWLLAHGLGLVVLTTIAHALRRDGVDNLGELTGWASVAARGWVLALFAALVLLGVPGSVGFVGGLAAVVGIVAEGDVELLQPVAWGLLVAAAIGLGLLGLLRTLGYAGLGKVRERAITELEPRELWACSVALVLALALGIAPGWLLGRSEPAERASIEQFHYGRCLAIEARNSARPRLHEDLREQLGAVCLDPVAQIRLYYFGAAEPEEVQP